MDRFDPVPDRRKLVILDPQHLGNVGSVYVEVEEADFITVVRECVGKVDRYGRFAHAAFSRKDQDDVLYVDALL